MAGGRAGGGRGKFAPSGCVDVKGVEIIDTIEAIIATEDVDGTVVGNYKYSLEG